MGNEILKNNVDSRNQVKDILLIEGCDPKDADYKILFLGNSITRHGIKEEIGWLKNCGMAASDMDHDYVHIVAKSLQKKYKNLSFATLSGGFWEQDFIDKEKLNILENYFKQFISDLVIIRLGENFKKDYINQGIDPYIYFNQLVKIAMQYSKRVIITSLFWEYPILNQAIKKVADDNKLDYVYLTDLSNDNKNEAIGEYWHEGVCLHPNDRGMKQIAERILVAINVH